ncbi:MAG: hypothetical protein HUJ26_02600 [Planctomycetaceae bacterium]|nr:hypothetical protein [Planctomycetaceae bacterium]
MGKETIEKIPCRWIEIEISGESAGISIFYINKLLIAEKALQAGGDPLKEVYRWIYYQPENNETRTIKDRKKLQALFEDQERNEEHGLNRILCGPYEDSKPITPQTIQSKLGKRDCGGILATFSKQHGTRSTHEKIIIRLHPDSPFGVVRWESLSRPQSDGQTDGAYHQVILLSDYGTNAKSAIPDQK